MPILTFNVSRCLHFAICRSIETGIHVNTYLQYLKKARILHLWDLSDITILKQLTRYSGDHIYLMFKNHVHILVSLTSPLLEVFQTDVSSF